MKFIYLSGSISVFSKYSTLWKKNVIYAVQITLKWMPWCQQQQCSILKHNLKTSAEGNSILCHLPLMQLIYEVQVLQVKWCFEKLVRLEDSQNKCYALFSCFESHVQKLLHSSHIPTGVLTCRSRVSLLAFHSQESSFPLHAWQAYQPLQHKLYWWVLPLYKWCYILQNQPYCSFLFSLWVYYAPVLPLTCEERSQRRRSMWIPADIFSCVFNYY